MACWTITGERQAARIRNLYLKAILGQDIGFFDMEANAGEAVAKISGGTFLIQDAMGEKVPEDYLIPVFSFSSEQLFALSFICFSLSCLIN